MINSTQKGSRLSYFSPIVIRNLFTQKRKSYLKYYFPLPSKLTQTIVDESDAEQKNISYNVERSENKSSFIINVSFSKNLGNNAKILKQCKSFFFPISSSELGRLLPQSVKTCGIIISNEMDGLSIQIIVPLSQWDKRELNTILKTKDAFTFNFKKKSNYSSFM